MRLRTKRMRDWVKKEKVTWERTKREWEWVRERRIRERERERVLWPSRQQHGLLGSICCSNVERPSERELKRAKQKVDSFALNMRKKHFSAEIIFASKRRWKTSTSTMIRHIFCGFVQRWNWNNFRVHQKKYFLRRWERRKLSYYHQSKTKMLLSVRNEDSKILLKIFKFWIPIRSIFDDGMGRGTCRVLSRDLPQWPEHLGLDRRPDDHVFEPEDGHRERDRRQSKEQKQCASDS